MNCSELRTKLTEIKTLKEELVSGLTQAQNHEDTLVLVNLQEKIEGIIKEIKEELIKRRWDEYSPRELKKVRYKEGYTCQETITEEDENKRSAVLTLQVLPDSRIVSGSDDGTIKIWQKDAQGAWQTETLSAGYESSALTLQTLPDGRIVSGGRDGTIKIWQEDGKGKWQAEETLSGHTSYVLTLQVLPDGRIVSGSSDKTIKIWQKDEQNRWQTETLSGHTDWVRTLQVLSDGRIVSGSSDKTIKIWDGEEIEKK